MADAIIYELHVGTFTPDGTLAAAQAKLPFLRDLGLNVIELLPIAAFPGERKARGLAYSTCTVAVLVVPLGTRAPETTTMEAP